MTLAELYPAVDEIVDVDHLSYSTCKKILNRGVDWALGTKLGLVDESYGKAADIGTMAHALVLGGDPEWIVSPYTDFRTNEAKAWKAEQTKTIIKESEFDQICQIADAIKAHPLAVELIDACNLEQKLEATIDGIKFVGYADGISQDRKTIFDLKTTGQFDSFGGRWYAYNQDYDLQASVYRLFGDDPEYYFIVAESVAPYRVQIFGTAPEFFDSGNVKLQKAIDEFNQFRLREGANDRERISFAIGETRNLQDVQKIGDQS